MRTSPLLPNYIQRFYLLISSHYGLIFQLMNIGGDTLHKCNDWQQNTFKFIEIFKISNQSLYSR